VLAGAGGGGNACDELVVALTPRVTTTASRYQDSAGDLRHTSESGTKDARNNNCYYFGLRGTTE
jgi:hypothetical protein